MEQSKGVTFYFVRHGETIFNYYSRMQGWSDSPLTEHGQKDALRSGLGLKDVKFDEVVTSDLRRTWQTAHLIMASNKYRQDFNITPMPEFREVGFGSFEGDLVENVWPVMYEELNSRAREGVTLQTVGQRELNAFHELDPDKKAENFMQFWMRVEKGLIKLLKKYRASDKNVLIVSHGMTIRYILHELILDFNPTEVGILNASVTKVQYRDGMFHLEAFNDVSHFEELTPELAQQLEQNNLEFPSQIRFYEDF